MKKKWLAGSLAAAMLLASIPIAPMTAQAADEFTVEAEDRVTGRGSIMSDSNASGGKYLGGFSVYGYSSYEIDVETAGNYKVEMAVSSIYSNGIAMLNNGGSNSGEVSVPNTGGWQTYQDIELNLWLEAGQQTVTVCNLEGTWNVDKMTFSYQDSNRDTENFKEYQGVYLQNRWKSQRMVERDGTVQYADTNASDYSSTAGEWRLIPDSEGWYTIQSISSGKYLVMTEGTQVVSLSDDGNTTDAGKWSIGTVQDYRMIYNKKYNGCGLNLEHQSDYPNQVLATNDAGPAFFSVQWTFSVPAQYHEYTIGADRIEGTTGTAIASDGNSITVQTDDGESTWTLSEDISGQPAFSAPNMPMMEAVYNLTMEESLLNIADGTYGDVFWTGANWSGQVWTRDTAMSVQYSLGWVFPEESENSLLQKVIAAAGNPQIWEEDTGTGGSYATSIDRIIMEIAGWEIYKATGDREFLEQIYNISKNTLEQDYHVAYDEESGLFKGETGGLDHCAKTYPDWMDPSQQDSIVNIAEGKPANANIIFAGALNIMAESARILGKDESEIADWEEKYADLKEAINEHFWLEDRGMYASWEYPEWMGSPVADKVDVIANGYAVLFDIADEQQKQEIMENYPLVVYGADTVWPQKNGLMASTIYHNRGVWPGWEATMMMAAKENGNLQLAEEILKSCVRGAGINLSNKEVIHFETGEGVGSDRQLWSVAGTLAGYYRVLFGMEYNQDGISFQPYVPEWMEGPYTLSNYPYRDAVLNLTVEGKGDTLTSIIVNGEEKSLDYVLPTDAQGTYNIVMSVTDSGERSEIHLEADSWAVCPDLPVLTEKADGTLTWEENPEYTYKLWTGKEYVDVSGGSYHPSRDIYGVYSLVAVDKNGVTSEMSKPIIVSPEGTKTVYEAEDGDYDSGNLASATSGYTGTGYVIDKLTDRSDLSITVNAPRTGRYQLSMVYDNLGDGGNAGGIRSVYVDGEDAGTLIFPTVKLNFQRSTHMFLELTEGQHTIRLTYNEDDWYDTNMCTSKGTKKNDVYYDSLTLQYLADGVIDTAPELTVDAPVRGESVAEAGVTAAGTELGYTTSIAWTEGQSQAEGTFKPETAYTATITLTIPERYVFASEAAPTEITVGGETVELAEGDVSFNTLHTVMTITHTFEKTGQDVELLLIVYNAYSALDISDDGSAFTEESRMALKNALEAAKLVIDNQGATEEEIQQSTSAILTAAAGLVLDTSRLQEGIDAAQQTANQAAAAAAAAQTTADKAVADAAAAQAAADKADADAAAAQADAVAAQADADAAQAAADAAQTAADRAQRELDAAKQDITTQASKLAELEKAAAAAQETADKAVADAAAAQATADKAAADANTAQAAADAAQEAADAAQEKADQATADAAAAKTRADEAREAADAARGQAVAEAKRPMLSIIVNAYKDIDLAAYTETSASALTEALTAAQSVLAKEDAAEEEIETAASNILAAAAGLVLDTTESESAQKAELAKLAAQAEEAQKLAAAAQQAAEEAKATLEKAQQPSETQQPGTIVQIVVGQTYDSGDYSYKVTDAEKMTVEVVGIKNTNLTKINVYNKVTLGGKSYKVTSIAASAFKGNKKVTSAVIGKNVATIGSSAFSGCTKLKKVTVKSTALTQIGSKAFYNCKNLKTLTLKSKVLKKVGANAFKGISKKAVIKVPAAKYKAYGKILAKKGQSAAVTIKK